MELDQESLARFQEALSRPEVDTPIRVDRSCLCGTTLHDDEGARMRHSGVVNFKERLCKDCTKEFKDFVRVICLSCKTLQAFLKPHTASTGYKFERNSAVHIEKCHICDPNITAAPVMEHLQFCRGRGIPTNVDADIVQESERNSLRGVKEADKLRGELKSSSRK